MSALETFTHTSNVSLLTQAIRSIQLDLLAIRHPLTPTTTGARRHHTHVSPACRDSSQTTQGKPWSFPSSFKKKGEGGSKDRH